MTFGLHGSTDHKRDLYLIANVRYAMIIAHRHLFVNKKQPKNSQFLHIFGRNLEMEGKG